MPASSSPRNSATAAPTSRHRRQRVQAAQTGMDVLKGLAELDGRASLTALSQHVQLPLAKVHRYLMSMVEAELVAQDPASQQYYLGAQAIRIGLAAMRQAEPIRLAEPALLRLRESLAVTCFIAVMGNQGPTIVRFEEPSLPVTVNVRAGSVLSLLWSATGRVFLSHLDDAAMDRMAEAELRRCTPQQRSQLAPSRPLQALRAELGRAPCLAVRDTNLPGISAVAAPIRDHSGKVVAVLTALGASGGFDAGLDGPIAQAVQREAQAVSRALGWI
ncbi:IclR family transcriptional regulator [Comamonadaceae bacterium OH2310_COT-174]|nr:IclR family transcriptional regulator [Comamonadaceae bacterium OH2310_COT-174]